MSAKKLGFGSVLAIVFGSQIGSGIFILPSSLAPYGKFGIYGWCLAGLGAILLAFIFAELCSRFPHTGGPHTYIKEVFGQIPSFFIGWAYWLVSWISSAVLVILAIAYLKPIIGEVSLHTNLFLEICLLAVITAINCKSVELSGKIEFVLTLLKFIPFVIVPVILINKFDVSNIAISETLTNLSNTELITSVTVLSFWGFLGIECATAPAGVVENPSKTIPTAIIVGTCSVAIIYFINNIAIMGIIPSKMLSLSQTPFADAINTVAGKNISILLSIIASIVCIGTLNAWVLTSAQISLGLAQDKLLPKFFAKKNATNSPYISVLVCCLGMIPILLMTKSETLSSQITCIIGFSVEVFLIVYIFCTIAFLKIVIQERKIIKIIIGICTLIFCIVIIINSSLQSLFVSSLFFISGIVVLPFIKLK